MGTSADAQIFYGYVWDGEDLPDHEFFEGDDEWEGVVAKRRGFSDPWDSYPDEIGEIRNYVEQRAAGDKWVRNKRAELDAWSAVKKAIKEEFGGCDFSSFGVTGDNNPYVYVEASEVRQSTYRPKDVTDLIDGKGGSKHKWWAALDKLLDELGMEAPQETPGWWLVSSFD